MGLGALQLYVALVHTYGGCRPPRLFLNCRMSAREINTGFIPAGTPGTLLVCPTASFIRLIFFLFYHYYHIIYLCKAEVYAQPSTIYKLLRILVKQHNKHHCL